MSTVRTNVTRTHERHAVPPLASDEIRIEAGGAGWMGTFSIIARAMIENVLEDGEPIAATLVYEDSSRHTRLVITGVIAEVSKTDFVFADGDTADIFDGLLAVTI